MPVIYKSLPGFVGYRVGTDGSVWSCLSGRGVNKKTGELLRPSGEWKLLKQKREATGYLTVSVSLNGVSRSWKVHRLVLMAFVGPCPSGHVTRHLDGSRDNNRLSNLEWSTQSVNLADRYKHGTNIVGARNGRAKLTDRQVEEIREKYRTGQFTQKQLAVAYGVIQPHISRLVRGTQWVCQ